MEVKPRESLPNVLVVCHGNICRSPLAGHILSILIGSDKVRDRGLKTKDGRIAAKKLRDWCEANGYNLGTHRSLQVTDEDFEWCDLVLYMDNSNLNKLKYLNVEKPCKCLGAYISQEKIKDPNFLSDPLLIGQIFEEVVEACKGFVEKECQ